MSTQQGGLKSPMIGSRTSRARRGNVARIQAAELGMVVRTVSNVVLVLVIHLTIQQMSATFDSTSSLQEAPKK